MLAQQLILSPYFTEEAQQKRLRNGSLLVNSPNLTALIREDSLVRTWPTNSWVLLGIDQNEEIAVFEADDSWLIAVLNLKTGEWFADDDPLFVHYSLQQDDLGDFLKQEATGRVFRLES